MLMNDAVCQSLSCLPRDLIQRLLAPTPVSTATVRDPIDRSKLKTYNWREIAQSLRDHGIGHLFYQRLTELGGIDLLDAETAAAWQSDANHSQIQCDLQRADAIEVTSEFQRSGIRHAFLKGFVFRESLYDPYWIRPGSDVDILINSRDIPAAKAAMRRAGFIQASRSADFRDFRPATRREIEDLEQWHFELVQFARRYRLKNGPEWLMGPEFARNAPFAFERLPEGPVLHSVFDIHWALHFAFVDDAPLETISSMTTADGRYTIPALSPEWQLIYTSYKLYFEAFDEPGKGLHKLVDLVALLSQPAVTQWDWDFVARITARHQLEAVMFYTVSAAENIIGRPVVPRELLESWRAIPFRGCDFRIAGDDSAHRPKTDLGDFIPMLLAERVPSAFPRC